MFTIDTSKLANLSQFFGFTLDKRPILCYNFWFFDNVSASFWLIAVIQKEAETHTKFGQKAKERVKAMLLLFASPTEDEMTGRYFISFELVDSGIFAPSAVKEALTKVWKDEPAKDEEHIFEYGTIVTAFEKDDLPHQGEGDRVETDVKTLGYKLCWGHLTGRSGTQRWIIEERLEAFLTLPPAFIRYLVDVWIQDIEDGKTRGVSQPDGWLRIFEELIERIQQSYAP